MKNSDQGSVGKQPDFKVVVDQRMTKFESGFFINGSLVVQLVSDQQKILLAIAETCD